MQPDHARPHEIEAALRLLLRHLGPRERDHRVARALELVDRGQMDSRGLFVLRAADHLSGVIACECIPGAGAVLWPPSVVGDPSSGLEDLLVHRACDWLRQQGARLAQCLLSPQEVHLARPLLRHGFSRITSLSYLSHNGSLAGETNVSTAQLCFEAYDPDAPATFHETLVRTYGGTLDCPEVNGVRTINEVIEGHRAQGFAPGRWQLARAGGEPVGVLVASATEGDEWDVGYMGLVPEARGRGFGAEMLHRALSLARAAGANRVTLCVDDRNAPAWRLYRRMGFVLYDSREVFLVVWRRAS